MNDIRGDASGNLAMEEMNSNYIAIHAGKISVTDLTDQGFTMQKAIDVSKEVLRNME